MHELSIAQNVVKIVQEEMRKHDAKSLKTVHLKIGTMSAIVPGSLSFCFDLITEGTEFEGSELIMDIIPLKGYCRDCQNEFEIEDYAFECPSCRSTKIKTISGREMDIVEIEVE
jgi:hydrogenase nickel incorporation protein HypA/HybF